MQKNKLTLDPETQRLQALHVNRAHCKARAAALLRLRERYGATPQLDAAIERATAESDLAQLHIERVRS